MDAARRFVFRHEWRVPQSSRPVAEVLLDLGGYPTWWPQVRAVVRLGEDDAWVRCRSLLPYTLDLLLHAESRQPPLLETSLGGDLTGWVRWRLAPEHGGTRLHFEQEVDLSSAWLARLARPLEPLLRWNHHVMMEGCRRGLAARLNMT
ncbi:polyketide cyclase [Nocardioides daejeonensis]|uniref:polyketide cyclase n=1 Tax=Nocardioides daejeonensis TaxID=1046556 RepID=UPI001EF656D8|nr:polyketide cyclase [Nocardioides daejeonensis]